MITITNQFNGEKAAIESKPYWTSHQFESAGRVCVARVDAHSLDRLKENGERVFLLLDLTQDDLDAIKSADGYSALPDNQFCGSVDSRKRPSTNRQGRVANQQEQAKAINSLQNEGF